MDGLRGWMERAGGAWGAATDWMPADLVPWLVVPLAVLVALGLHTVAWRVGRRAAEGAPEAVRLVEVARRPTRLLAVFAVLAAMVGASDLPPDWREVLARAAVAVAVVFAGWTLILAVGELAERAVRRHRIEDDEDNLAGRKAVTQIRVLRRTLQIVLALLTAAVVLSTFEGVRRYGVSLFASAGAAGLVLGFAARPVLANLIAGVQIALTQPIRLEDVVIVEGEWGRVEEIGATYVVVRIWDLRRLVVPLSHFIEKPFENWTRDTAQIVGQVVWHLDHAAPVERIRREVERAVRASALWDGAVVGLQVIEADRDGLRLRALMSARNAAAVWDLRCEVREAVMTWLQSEHPEALPRVRAEVEAR